MKNTPKVRISQLVDGTWVGYEGRKRVREFGYESQAREWLFHKTHPRYDWYGKAVHPETGEKAPKDQMWIKSLMGGWVLESVYTPYTASCASETYWCS